MELLLYIDECKGEIAQQNGPIPSGYVILDVGAQTRGLAVPQL